MAAFTGKKFSVYNANSFVSSFASDSIYFYVGKMLPWDVETSPPSSNDSPSDHNKIWDKVVGLLRVTPDKVSIGIKRNNWTSGVIYEKYDHANSIVGDGTGFYVLGGITNKDVYKCLDNNGDSASIEKPTHKNFAATRGQDKYVWKYMYTISDSGYTKFATADHLPIERNSDVELLSKDGILHLPISANNTEGIGSFYRGVGFVNSSFQSIAANPSIWTTVHANTSTNEIKIVADSGLAKTADYYNNSAFFVTSGNAKGTYRRIVATISEATDTTANLGLSSSVSNIANGDLFTIGPIVTVSDDLTGRGFLGIANVNEFGNVTSIDVNKTGSGYANGDAVVSVHGDYHPTTDNPTLSDGTGATVKLTIPPFNAGHGNDPAIELNARYAIVSVETPVASDHQTGTFVGYGNEIRQVGLIRNPIDAEVGTLQSAYKSSYDAKTTIYFASPTTITFQKDQRLYNTPVGVATASGLIWNICQTDSQNQYISLSDVQGQFANGDILYNRLGDSETISSASLSNHQYPLYSGVAPITPVVDGGVAKYTGEILYHENIAPVTRTLDAKENHRIIFEF